MSGLSAWGWASGQGILSSATQELTNERLMSINFIVAGKSNTTTSLAVAYVSTDIVSNTREQKDAFRVDLDSAVSRVLSSDCLFVLTCANSRTGVRIGDEYCKVVEEYGREAWVNDRNGTSPLRFAGDTKFALVNTVYPSPRDACLVHSTVPDPRIRNVSTTSSRGHYTTSLFETSLPIYRRVRIPTTTSCAPESDCPADSIVIENSEPPQGASIGRRAITSDTDRGLGQPTQA